MYLCILTLPCDNAFLSFVTDTINYCFGTKINHFVMFFWGGTTSLWDCEGKVKPVGLGRKAIKPPAEHITENEERFI